MKQNEKKNFIEKVLMKFSLITSFWMLLCGFNQTANKYENENELDEAYQAVKIRNQFSINIHIFKQEHT